MRLRRSPVFGGRKPSKKKRSAGSPCGDEGGEQRRGAGQGMDRDARRRAAHHQRRARIRKEWRAGVADERQRLAAGHRLHRRGDLRLVRMRVEAPHRPPDAVMVEEAARHPRVLRQDPVGGRQRRERAQCDVSEIADRCRNHMQARRQSACGDGDAAEAPAKVALGRVGCFCHGPFIASRASPAPQPPRK